MLLEEIMFLTNNFRSIHNLLLYSEGIHLKRIDNYEIEKIYNNYLKSIGQYVGYVDYLDLIKLNMSIYNNILPYGNINRSTQISKYTLLKHVKYKKKLN